MEESRLSFLGRRWQKRPAAEAARALIAAGYDPLIASMLAGRGVVDAEEAKRFLDPGFHCLSPPRSLKGVGEAAERIRRAIKRGEIIGVYGDYDVDGQTSTALLTRVLRALGARVATYIPHRTREGYGVNIPALAELQGRGCTLVVTVDCGITSVEEALWAERAGLDLIITDHHQPKEELPRAVAIVNPHLDPGYPCPDLAGCGVAFKLAQAVAEELTGGTGLADEYVELVALGTVADVVPLLGENRALVKEGLRRINGKGAVPGIQALKDVAGVHGEVTAGHIGYVLGPRLNAVGRVADASVGLALLLAPTYDEALPLAKRLEEENATRRRIEEQVIEEAHEAVRRLHDPAADHGLVVEGAGWHPGVVGIVASRIAEAYYRPTVVLSIMGEEAKGSARSIPGFDLYAALCECSDLFTSFGGHHHAAGITLPAARVEEFRERFRQVTRRRLSKDDLIPVLAYDAEVEPGAIDLKLVEAIERLEPFGVGNPTPVLVARGLRAEASAVGKEKDHLKLRLYDEGGGLRLDGIGFGLAEELVPRLSGRARVDVAFVPVVNEWNGERKVELLIKDVREAEMSAGPAVRAVAAYEELAAAREPSPLGGALRGGGVRPAPVSITEIRSMLRERTVVDARGFFRAGFVEELVAGGRSVLAVAASPYLAVELARELAAASALLKAKTFVLSESPSRGRGRLVRPALPSPPWVGIAQHLPDPGAEGAEEWGALIARSKPVILLCQVPAPPRAGLIDLYRLAAMAPGAPVYLAFDREQNRKAASRLLDIYPDRDRLARLYVALKEEQEAAGRVERTALIGRVRARWPSLKLEESVDEALAVFLELGLVRELDGGLTLVEPGGKVDLTKSLRYNESIAIRDHYLAFADKMAVEPAAEVMDRLIERGAPWWP